MTHCIIAYIVHTHTNKNASYNLQLTRVAFFWTNKPFRLQNSGFLSPGLDIFKALQLKDRDISKCTKKEHYVSWYGVGHLVDATRSWITWRLLHNTKLHISCLKSIKQQVQSLYHSFCHSQYIFSNLWSQSCGISDVGQSRHHVSQTFQVVSANHLVATAEPKQNGTQLNTIHMHILHVYIYIYMYSTYCRTQYML